MTLSKSPAGHDARWSAPAWSPCRCPGSAGAAEVTAGRLRSTSRSPASARFEAFGGELDDRAARPRPLARSLDFRNDTEVHVLARGKSEETGIEYGGTVEFEADTNSTANTDETWLFLRGGWGEVRLGDEDGVVDNSAVGGQTIAAGTGGIDGSDAVITAAPRGVPDQHQRRDQGPLLHAHLRRLQRRRVLHADPAARSTAAPRTASTSASKDGIDAMEGENVVEGGLVYDGEFGGVGILASVVGLYGELKNGGEDDVRRRRVVRRPGRRQRRPVRLQARRRLRHRQGRRTPRATSSPPASALRLVRSTPR